MLLYKPVLVGSPLSNPVRVQDRDIPCKIYPVLLPSLNFISMEVL